MRPRRSIVLLTAVAAIAASGISAGAAAQATTPLPSVVTVDNTGANSVYVSQGSTPTLARPGHFDIFPWAGSLDGNTSMWTVGIAFGQIYVVNNGRVMHVWNNVAAGPYAGDMTPTGSTLALGLSDPTLTNTLDVYLADGTDDTTLHTYHVAGGDALMDVAISQDGSTFYVLEAGSPPTLRRCAVSTGACTTFTLTGLNAPTSDSANGTWATVSADGTAMALNVVTNPGSSSPTFEGYAITGLSTTPVVTDAGPLQAQSTGRFLTNTLYVAEPGQLLTFNTVASFAKFPDATTAVPMTGGPQLIIGQGSGFGGAFGTSTPFSTLSFPLVYSGGRYSDAKSSTVYLNTGLTLRPAVTPGNSQEQSTWDYYSYWQPASTFLLYSYDRGVHWLSYPWWSTFTISRNVWIRSSHLAETNAGASFSAAVAYTARPYVVARYTASTRHLYGTANVPSGTRIIVQRRASSGSWLNYYTSVPVVHYAWSAALPAGHALWRVVVPATSLYIAAISAAVAT